MLASYAYFILMEANLLKSAYIGSLFDLIQVEVRAYARYFLRFLDVHPCKSDVWLITLSCFESFESLISLCHPIIGSCLEEIINIATIDSYNLIIIKLILEMKIDYCGCNFQIDSDVIIKSLVPLDS